jgi:hypothetical protein
VIDGRSLQRIVREEAESSVLPKLFRSGLERLLRGAPGGDAFVESAERLRDILQGMGEQDLRAQEPGFEAKLDRIGEDVRSLADCELPALRKEVAELRELLADLRHERGD